MEDCSENRPLRKWSHGNGHWHIENAEEPAERCQMARALVKSLSLRNGIFRDSQKAAKLIDYFYNSGEYLIEFFSSKKENYQLEQMWHTCQDWKRNVTDQQDAPLDMLKYHDHSSLECNDTVTKAQAVSARIEFQKKAITRLISVFETLKKKNPRIKLSHFCLLSYQSFAMFTGTN